MNEMMSKGTTALSILAGFLLIAAIAFGGWHLKRWWNYSFGYQSQVITEICIMVNPEGLTDIGKERCNG